MTTFLKKYQYLIYQLLAHAVTVWAIFAYSWQDWLLVIPFYILFSGVGISITYHRYYTHKAFNFPAWVKAVGLTCGTLNGHGPSYGWSYKHALHHVLSDAPGDPHSPIYNNHFWLYWANLTHGVNSHESTANVDVSEKINNPGKLELFFERYYWYIHLVYAVLMLLLGPKWLVFAYLVPGALSWLAFGYGVVIAAHYNGYVSYPSTDDHSKNNTWVSLLVFGEGYQNNHHAFPQDGKYSRAPGEVDPLGWIFKKLFGTKPESN